MIRLVTPFVMLLMTASSAAAQRPGFAFVVAERLSELETAVEWDDVAAPGDLTRSADLCTLTSSDAVNRLMRRRTGLVQWLSGWLEEYVHARTVPEPMPVCFPYDRFRLTPGAERVLEVNADILRLRYGDGVVDAWSVAFPAEAEGVARGRLAIVAGRLSGLDTGIHEQGVRVTSSGNCGRRVVLSADNHPCVRNR